MEDIRDRMKAAIDSGEALVFEGLRLERLPDDDGDGPLIQGNDDGSLDLRCRVIRGNEKDTAFVHRCHLLAGPKGSLTG